VEPEENQKTGLRAGGRSIQEEEKSRSSSAPRKPGGKNAQKGGCRARGKSPKKRLKERTSMRPWINVGVNKKQEVWLAAGGVAPGRDRENE